MNRDCFQRHFNSSNRLEKHAIPLDIWRQEGCFLVFNLHNLGGRTVAAVAFIAQVVTVDNTIAHAALRNTFPATMSMATKLSRFTGYIQTTITSYHVDALAA